MTLHVPGGSCLYWEVRAINATIGEGQSVTAKGYVIGYLTDAPAS